MTDEFISLKISCKNTVLQKYVEYRLKNHSKHDDDILSFNDWLESWFCKEAESFCFD